MKSSFELHNEVEDNPTLVGFELENLEKEIMQMDEHNPDLYISLFHNQERFEINENTNPTITIKDSHEPSSLAGGKAETKIHEEECKSLQGN